MILVQKGSEDVANIVIMETDKHYVFEEDKGGILEAHYITDAGSFTIVLARGKRGYVALAKQLLKIAKQKPKKERRR